MLSSSRVVSLVLSVELLLLVQGFRVSKRNGDVTSSSVSLSNVCGSQWGNSACSGSNCHTCGDRITWLMNTYGTSMEAAGQQVAGEFPSECGQCGSSSPSPTPPSSGSSIRVVSYNLFWWNAFGQESWKSDHIIHNIKYNLQADALGLQECDEPWTIQSRADYIPASAFAGAQGVSVKPGVFSVGQTGSRDIGATGFWGPRHVTWAQLTHAASGNTLWHFNTHWCVRDCDANKRYGGAVNMLSIIREKAGSSPVIITGDFNAGMGEPGIQHFLQNGFALAVSHWVDAIFYSTAHFSVVSTETGDAAHSDHRPVIADLQFK